MFKAKFLRKASDPEYREVVVNERWGSAEGYRASTASSSLPNFLESECIHDEELVQELRNRHQTYAVLKNINVSNPRRRGKGYGSSLLEEFMSEAGDVPILLIADKYETQKKGFDLVKWYEGFGFKVLRQTPSGPLMILEPE
jgi:ribosomal protein S18 acetylase RimI-like enzyme